MRERWCGTGPAVAGTALAKVPAGEAQACERRVPGTGAKVAETSKEQGNAVGEREPAAPRTNPPTPGPGRQALLLLFEISLLCMFVTDG